MWRRLVVVVASSHHRLDLSDRSLAPMASSGVALTCLVCELRLYFLTYTAERQTGKLLCTIFDSSQPSLLGERYFTRPWRYLSKTPERRMPLALKELFSSLFRVSPCARLIGRLCVAPDSFRYSMVARTASLVRAVRRVSVGRIRAPYLPPLFCACELVANTCHALSAVGPNTF